MTTRKIELENLLKRIQADFDNYRNRVEQERVAIKKSANAELILALLPVLDNFKRATQHAPQDNWAQGIKAIEKQLEETLNLQGLTPIAVNPGEKFDPAVHEAVVQERSQQYPSGNVAKLVELGYRLNGRVLRPAKVAVAE